MQRPYSPFFAITGLLILTIPWSTDFETSVVPGWQTAIFLSLFIINVFISVTQLINK